MEREQYLILQKKLNFFFFGKNRVGVTLKVYQKFTIYRYSNTLAHTTILIPADPISKMKSSAFYEDAFTKKYRK